MNFHDLAPFTPLFLADLPLQCLIMGGKFPTVVVGYVPRSPRCTVQWAGCTMGIYGDWGCRHVAGWYHSYPFISIYTICNIYIYIIIIYLYIILYWSVLWISDDIWCFKYLLIFKPSQEADFGPVDQQQSFPWWVTRWFFLLDSMDSPMEVWIGTSTINGHINSHINSH